MKEVLSASNLSHNGYHDKELDSNYREAFQNIQTVVTLHNVVPRIQLDDYQLLGGIEPGLKPRP